MVKKAVSGLVLTILMISMLAMALRITVGEAEASIEYPYSTDMPVMFIASENPTPSTLEVNVSVFHLTNRFYSTDTEWKSGDQQLGPYADLGRYNYSLGNLLGFDISFSWNPAILNYTGHTILAPVETYPDGVLHNPTLTADNRVNETAGTYRVAVTSPRPALPFNAPHANASFFTMSFDVLSPGSYDLSLDGADLAVDVVSFPGVSANIPYRTSFLHDVAVRDIEPVQTGTDPVLDVNVTIQNQGDFDETSSITLFANGSNVGAAAGVNIGNRDFKDVTISWDTTGYPKGTYNMTAVATAVPNEYDTNDLTYTTYFNHDIAVTDIKSTDTGTDPILDVNITLYSQDYEETFNVNLYANGSNVGTAIGVSVKPRDSKDVTISWDTTGYPKGTYNMTAVASAVLGEVDTSDNKYQTYFVHNVKVADFGAVKDLTVELTTSQSIVGEHYSIGVNATLQNPGDFEETFNVTFYANGTFLDTVTDVNLKPGGSVEVSYTWDTTGFAYGNYTVSANATAVPGETYIIDNVLGGWIFVTLAGDVDGDHDVDIFDIVTMAGSYGSSKGQPKYNPVADIDGDGDVDIFDIVAAAGNYSKSW